MTDGKKKGNNSMKTVSQALSPELLFWAISLFKCENNSDKTAKLRSWGAMFPSRQNQGSFACFCMDVLTLIFCACVSDILLSTGRKYQRAKNKGLSMYGHSWSQTFLWRAWIHVCVLQLEEEESHLICRFMKRLILEDTRGSGVEASSFCIYGIK